MMVIVAWWKFMCWMVSIRQAASCETVPESLSILLLVWNRLFIFYLLKFLWFFFGMMKVHVLNGEYGRRYTKKSLMSWVVVIPKEGMTPTFRFYYFFKVCVIDRLWMHISDQLKNFDWYWSALYIDVGSQSRTNFSWFFQKKHTKFRFPIKSQSTTSVWLSAYTLWLQTHRQTP